MKAENDENELKCGASVSKEDMEHEDHMNDIDPTDS